MGRDGGLFRTVGISALSVVLLFSVACSKTSPAQPAGGTVRVRVTDTETGSALNNIPVTLDCYGEEFDAKTQGGIAKFEINAPKQCTLEVNMTNSQVRFNNAYIPSIVENIGLSGGEQIEIDIVREDYLNPNKHNWNYLLNAYRGKNNGGVNQVWVTQPDKWIVYDPHGYLKKYSDPKNNPIFNNIMEGFKAIEQYTRGFIKAPSPDEVIIKYKEEKIPNGAVGFIITDGEAWEMDDENSNNEIIRSGAGPTGHYTIIEELTSSVQGGDNDSDIGVFNKGVIKLIDLHWGRFNYWKRKPGDVFRLHYKGYKIVEVRKDLNF